MTQTRPGSPAPADAATLESHGIPPAEVAVTPELVRHLLAEQAPQLAHLGIAAAGEGWDNVMMRIGPDLAARLPRRAGAEPLLLAEQAWLERIGSALPICVPTTVVKGVPGSGYPFHWSVVPWRPGTRLGTGQLASGTGRMLAECLAALHRLDPTGAPVSPVRGGALSGRDSAVAPRLARLAGADWVGAAWMGQMAALWQTAVAAPVADAAVLLHGDLHPGNVIVSASGALVSLVDWGDLCVGDAATDLAALWLLLPDAVERAAFLAHYPADADQLTRARGWAINLASALVETGLGSGATLQTDTGRVIFQRLWDEISGRTNAPDASASLPGGADRL